LAIGFAFLFLSILVALSIPFLSRWAERSASHGRRQRLGPEKEREAGNPAPRRKRGCSLKDLFEIEDIRQGVIVLTNNRYRAVLAVGSTDFSLLSEAEQTGVEDALMGMMAALSRPVQFMVTTEAVDTTRSVADIVNHLTQGEANEKLAEYGNHMAAYLNTMMLERSATARKNYIILTAHTQGGLQQAKNELVQQANAVYGVGLAKINISVRMLDSEELIDLLYQELNRGSLAKPSAMVAAGAMDLYKRGRNLEAAISS